MSTFFNAAKKKRNAGMLSPSSSNSTTGRRVHRRINSNSSAASIFSTMSGFDGSLHLTQTVDVYVNQRTAANPGWDLDALADDVTNHHIHPHSEQPWAFKLASQTDKELLEMLGRLKGQKEANDAAMEACTVRDTNLKAEIEKAHKKWKELDELNKDITQRLVEATADYQSLKKSSEENETMWYAACKANSALLFPIHFVDKLSRDVVPGMEKHLSGNVPLEETRNVLHLFDWQSIDNLDEKQLARCHRVLANLGLEKNDNFQALWERERIGIAANIWDLVQRSSKPYLATGKRDLEIMKMRLANYLDIPVPEEFYIQHYGQDNDDSVGGVGGVLDDIQEQPSTSTNLGSIEEEKEEEEEEDAPVNLNNLSDEEIIAILRARGALPPEGAGASTNHATGESNSTGNGTGEN